MTGQLQQGLDRDLERRLIAVVGPENVLTSEELRAGFERDWTGRFGGSASGVVRPGSTEEVVAVMRLCSERSLAVIPQGGNTSLSGGSVPRGGELVVSLVRMHRVIAVDRAAGQLEAQGGATLAAVHDAARAQGLAFGLDLGARDSATVGGLIATDAGGARAMRYGTMRAQVVGLEAVMPDGRRVSRLRGLLKDNAGYSIPHLLIGSEGTLGIVTSAKLRLIVAARRRVAALFGLSDLTVAVKLLALLRESVPSLEAADFFFDDGVELAIAHGANLGPGPGRRCPCYLLVECAAEEDPVPQLAAALDGADDLYLAVAVADDTAGRERLWRWRESQPDAIVATGLPHKIDIALPTEGLHAFVCDLRAMLREARPQCRVIFYGHLGDGNVHVNILGLGRDDASIDGAVLKMAAARGGTISAEHGIGTAKVDYLPLVRSPADLDAMCAIKRAIDPKGIMNPGAVLPWPAPSSETDSGDHDQSDSGTP